MISIEFSADPQKYKPTNSLCFSYPQNFKPSKLKMLIWYYCYKLKASHKISELQFTQMHLKQIPKHCYVIHMGSVIPIDSTTSTFFKNAKI